MSRCMRIDAHHIPDCWQIVRLDDVTSLRRQQVNPAGDDSRPYVALEHILSGGVLNGCGKASDSISNKTSFRKGDTLYGKLRPNLRKVVRVTFDGVCSTDILAVSSRGSVAASFLSQLLRSDPLHRHAMRGITGTKMPRTSWGHLRAFRFGCPPLPEQRAIAEVLDAIDEAVERTEAVIDATEGLRGALLHELLTRGVPGWHTEWREVLGLGTVPAAWRVVRLGEVATLQRGVDLPIQDRVKGLIPVYGSNGILDLHARALHPGPGVITGRSGSIGVVYFSTGSYWPLNTTLYVRDFHGNSERFIYYLLSHLRLERFAASTGVPSLNRNFVHPQSVALPPLPEQQAIADALDGMGDAIERAREERDGLQALKAATADALLTGRVRVGMEKKEACPG